MNLSLVGLQIAHLQQARGLTLEALALAAGVDRPTLAALEAGKLPEPDLEKVALLCAAVCMEFEARPPEFEAPLMRHWHLPKSAGRKRGQSELEHL